MADDIRLQRQQQAQAILARVQEVLPSVLARHPVVAAYVYGSVARGTVLPTSDVDIALVLTEPLLREIRGGFRSLSAHCVSPVNECVLNVILASA